MYKTILQCKIKFILLCTWFFFSAPHCPLLNTTPMAGMFSLTQVIISFKLIPHAPSPMYAMDGLSGWAILKIEIFIITNMPTYLTYHFSTCRIIMVFTLEGIKILPLLPSLRERHIHNFRTPLLQRMMQVCQTLSSYWTLNRCSQYL